MFKKHIIFQILHIIVVPSDKRSLLWLASWHSALWLAEHHNTHFNRELQLSK